MSEASSERKRKREEEQGDTAAALEPAASEPAPPPPSDADALDAVLTLLHSEVQCAICHGLVVAPLILLPCSHRFCGACIRPWTRSHDTCPTCRTVMRGPPALDYGTVLRLFCLSCPSRGPSPTLAAARASVTESRC